MMREIKTIAGLRVISVDEGAGVGTVSQVVVDLASGGVLGLIVGTGAAERGVLAAEIQTLGTDVIMVSGRDVAKPLSELPELEKRKSSNAHLLPVFTNTGRRLGIVSSVFIDPLEKVVTRYEVSSGALKDLADGLLILPILPGTVHGQDAVIVPEEAVREDGRETGGLLARFTQWGDSARKQYQQVAEKTEKLVETGSEALKKEAEVVRERAKVVSEKAKELGEKATEKAKDLGEAAAEKAKEVGGAAAEKAKDLGEAAAEKAKEVTDKAKDVMAHAGDEEGTDVPTEAGADKPAEEAAAPAEEPVAECSADKPSCGCGCGCDAQE